MTAKEYLFKKYPALKDDWGKTGHDDDYTIEMMESYHKMKVESITNEMIEEEIEKAGISSLLAWHSFYDGIKMFKEQLLK